MHEGAALLPGVLIVEDEKIVALDIKRRLEQFNYRVLGVTDSAEKAIIKVSELRPDIIIMDIILSGKMDGIQAATIIGEQFDIPFIFLTASSDEVSLQRAKLSGPHGYIIKPFEARDLKSAVEIALHNSAVEKKLRESELWLNATLNSISDAVITTDMDQQVRFLNPSAERFLGYNIEQCKGHRIEDIYAPVPDATNELIITGLQSTDTSAGVENKILQNPEGKSVYIEESISLIKDRKGKEHGYVYSFRDVTKRRTAELAALASRDFYLSLFEDFPTPVWRSNAEGDFNYFNKTWLSFTGRSIENEIFHGWIEGIRDTDRQKFQDVFHTALHTKQRFEVEFELLNKDNQYRWIICIGTPLLGFDGNFRGFIGACIDISHMITAQNELMRAKNAAESANMAKVRFLSNMSHEVRTPLNGIIGILNLLADEKLEREPAEYVKMAQSAASTLLELLNNLLDISKIEAKKDSADVSEFILNGAVQDILPPFYYQAKIKRIQVKTSFGFADDQKICTDRKKLQQILINLMSNAIKFTETGTVNLTVNIESQQNNPTTKILHIAVEDTGIGIAAENHGKVFESFTQIDNSSTRKFSGAGLGLAIVKSITETMNGSIWFSSEPGRGSQFHVVLPISKTNLTRNKNRELLVK